MTGEGRPVQAQTVYEQLTRLYDFRGGYQAVVRHLRRRYGAPPVRALRRVETPPGVQSQHDWFDVVTRLAGQRTRLSALVGTLSHSRGRFVWVSREATQLAWHQGHVALLERYGGVPLWVRIDNLKTGVASGAGPTAVLNASYRVLARSLGFEIDPCRPATGSDKGKAERSVRTFRDHFGDLFRQDWHELEALQAALDERAERLLDRLTCPVTGTSVREALAAEFESRNSAFLRGDIELPEKDWPILGGAVGAGATHLITGDVMHFGPHFGKKLLGVLVLSPAGYLRAPDGPSG